MWDLSLHHFTLLLPSEFWGVRFLVTSSYSVPTGTLNASPVLLPEQVGLAVWPEWQQPIALLPSS